MRIIALRHGQSQYNLLGLCNDDPVRAVDLTGLGVEQARAAAQRLVSEPIEQIFCSPLLRARRTAEIVAEYLGLAPQVEERLADIRSGFDDLPVSDYLHAISTDPVDTRVNGGESLRDYQVRVEGFLHRLAARPWQCVLLVAHEETLRILAAFYQALDLREVAGRPYDNCVPYDFHSPRLSTAPEPVPSPQGEGQGEGHLPPLNTTSPTPPAGTETPATPTAVQMRLTTRTPSPRRCDSAPRPRG